MKRPSEAFRSAKLFDAGCGYLVVSRFKADGRVESGFFLLDENDFDRDGSSLGFHPAQACRAESDARGIGQSLRMSRGVGDILLPCRPEGASLPRRKLFHLRGRSRAQIKWRFNSSRYVGDRSRFASRSSHEVKMDKTKLWNAVCRLGSP